MGEFFYVVLEEQISQGGSYGLLHDYFTKDQYAQAEARFHTVAAAACLSDIPYHAVCIKRSDGLILEGKTCDRRTEAANE